MFVSYFEWIEKEQTETRSLTTKIFNETEKKLLMLMSECNELNRRFEGPADMSRYQANSSF